MKILLFQIRYLCHKSNELFVDNLAEEFEKLGHEVTKCNIIDSKDMESVLNALVGLHFDAMIDFNSVLPSTEMEEGGYFLDKIDAPFYNYIVDHPLFHHDFLNIPLNNYNVICIDNNHYNYLNNYYPNIKNKFVQPLAPTKGMIDCEYEKRNMDILYPVSYMPFKKAEKMLLEGTSVKGQIKLNDMEMRWAKDVVDIMLNNPSTAIEDAFTQVLKDSGLELEKEDFKMALTRLHISDIYLRCYLREKMLDYLLEAGNRVTACGKDWELYDNKAGKLLEIYPDVSYTTAMQYMQNSKAVVNVTPGFKWAIHDRATSAMLNEALLLSDNSIIEKETNAPYDFSPFKIKNDATIWFDYKKDSMKEAAHLIKEKIDSKDIFVTARKENKKRIEESLSWEIAAKNILKHIEE